MKDKFTEKYPTFWHYFFSVRWLIENPFHYIVIIFSLYMIYNGIYNKF